MANCKKCGFENKDDANFCANCGSRIEKPAELPPAEPVKEEKKEEKNRTEFSEELKERLDIQNNKGYSYCSYLGILVLIPIFMAPNSKFAKFHANQGLVLMIASIAYTIASRVLSAILGALFSLVSPFLGTAINVVFALPALAFLALAIIGIINVSNGEFKKLPIIGDFEILK